MVDHHSFLLAFSSFEALCVRFSIAASSYTLLTVYRPPNSSLPLILTEFSALLENLISSPSELIITGDFNLHVDNPSEYYASQFLSLLQSFDLSQLVSCPTHKKMTPDQIEHTLDLLITRTSSNIFSNPLTSDHALSDHLAVHADLLVPSHSVLFSYPEFL